MRVGGRGSMTWLAISARPYLAGSLQRGIGAKPARAKAEPVLDWTATSAPAGQGLTLAHFRAQLEDLRDTSLTLELNLSTLGPHPRVTLGYMGDNLSLSRAERGTVS